MFAFDAVMQRLRQGCQTMPYPAGAEPSLPDRHGGALRVEPSRCPPGCQACAQVCPTAAISIPGSAREQTHLQKIDAIPPQQPPASAAPGLTLDLGRCLFCSACAEVCPAGAITPTGKYQMSVRRRSDLHLGAPGMEEVRLAEALDAQLRRLFGRSLRLRQVSAGGCNACEADTNVLGTIGWDLGRFGIQFVASPRHADGLLITGPVTRNMQLALRKTYEATPSPKLVIATGACAISGGPFVDLPEVLNGAESVLKVDLFIPGCPPHPLTILDGLLRLLGRLPQNRLANKF